MSQRMICRLTALMILALAVPVTSVFARDSRSGPRGPSGGVEYAPVDSLGPTLAPDERLTPNSGWNNFGNSPVAGPQTGPLTLQPAFAPPPPPPPPPAKHKPYIVVQ